MIFQDNVIKEYLKNVYFITGTPCGGKTTISRELAKRHNLLVYDVDEQFSYHQKISNSTFQPSMNKVFKDADEFFGRTVEEYKKWLIDNTREQLDFVLLDLIRLSQNKIVLCDCHLTLEEAEKYTEASRIVFLIKEPSNLIEDYCGRSDHQAFNDFINSASDIEKAKADGFSVYATVPAKDAEDITEIVFPESSISIIGNEGSGISEEVKAAATELITINMLGRAESLNASMAGAITMWEMLRGN